MADDHSKFFTISTLPGGSTKADHLEGLKRAKLFVDNDRENRKLRTYHGHFRWLRISIENIHCGIRMDQLDDAAVMLGIRRLLYERELKHCKNSQGCNQ